MKKPRFAQAWMLAALLVLASGARADDIDIYDGISGGGTTPNVLIVLDNAANFDASAPSCSYVDSSATPTMGATAGGIEQCAINNVISSLPVNADGTAKINIGMMVYNANAFTSYGCNSGGNGGCLIQPLTPMTAANKAAWMTWIKGWTLNNMKASGEATAAAMQESWAYYAGKTGLSGRSYSAIKPTVGCQSNYVIFIGNAFKTSGTPGDGGRTSPSSALTSAPGITTALKADIAIPSGCYGVFSNSAIPGYKPFLSGGKSCSATTSPDFSCGSYNMPNHTDSSGLYADEWARYMFQTDVNGVVGGTEKITTYTIGLLGSNCSAEYPALLKSMATVGGGKYFATSSYSAIADALGRILNEVQAVNSVFASASLPVSVNAQGSFNNQVFIGMFRPDATGNPRWVGNLKQYQFVGSSDQKKLGDKNGKSALSASGTGFLAPDAVSFWTKIDTSVSPDKDGGYWLNKPSGSGKTFDSPDGEVVEKGGAAQQIRLENLVNNYTTTPNGPRRLYTYCPTGASCNSHLNNSANAFATTNSSITFTQLGVTSATERDTLIKWMRGEDNAGDEQGPGGSVTVRPSVHGDVLHSRPVVIDYGGTTGVVVYYGANDGVFRAVNGNQTASIGSVAAGGELWGVVLPEFMGKLNRERINSPLLKLPSTATTIVPTPKAKDYFVDGSTGLYQQVKNGVTTKAIIYLTMRRGGRLIYAIDVTSPTDPQILWKKSNADTDYSEMGQTWSKPRVTAIKGYKDSSGNAKPVLIFGGGYDSAEDAEPPSADTMGRGIFIVDAMTGAVVKSFTNSTVTGMNYSIAADIAFLDRDADGFTERLYAADVGGNIWRVDLEPTGGTGPANWQIMKLAALGCNSGTCASNTTPRKFLFPPAIVPIGAPGKSDSYDALLLGSGDREHPTYSTASSSAYKATNRLYMLKDTKIGKDGSGASLITESDLFNATSSTYSNTGKGYYINLLSGEKAVNAPLILSGTAFLGTNQANAPSANSCTSSLGVARSYAIDIFTGNYTNVVLDGGGLPPSPISGLVNFNGKLEQICMGCIKNYPDKPCIKSGLEECSPPPNDATKMKRTYWYKN